MHTTMTSAIAGLAYVLSVAAPLSAQVGGTPDPSGGVTIEYIAHASFRIISPAGQSVLIDPFASQVWLGYDFPPGVEADAVVVTHPHYDHDAGEYRGRPWPWADDVRVFRYPGEFQVGDAVVTGIRGRHVDPYGREFGQVNTIFVFETGGLRIAHVGDNGPLTDENIQAMGRVDVLMLPIDGEYHILSQAAIEDAIRALRPRVVVPMHYRIPELEPWRWPRYPRSHRSLAGGQRQRRSVRRQRCSALSRPLARRALDLRFSAPSRHPEGGWPLTTISKGEGR